jgi:hypothetical protein
MTWRDGVRVFIGRCVRRRAAANAPSCVPVTNLLAANLFAASLLLCSLLAGCATDGPGALMVDPGRYSVYHCDGLAARLKALLAREQDLTNLMQRASEGGGGALIGNLTYRADYENTLSEEKLLRRTAAEKKCELPPPAVPASPTQAVYSAPPAPAAYGAPPAPAAYGAPPPPLSPAAPPPAGAPVFQSDQTIH